MAALEPNRSDTSGLVTERWLGADVRCYRDRPRTIIELLDRAWRLHPHRIALETPEGDVTYAELAELVDGAAERLAEEGIAAGDKVAVALRNGLDIVVAIWACARLEAVFVGLSTRLAPPQWAYVLGHSGASLALAHPEYLESLQQAAADAGIPADRVRPVGDHLTGRRRRWDADRAFPDQDSSYAVIYTSGTTGRPKASRMVHRGTVHSAIAYVRTMALTADDRTAITFPLYYMTGHIAQLSTMMLTGGTCVTLTDLAAGRLVALVAEKRITYLMVTPSLWPLLLRVPQFSWPELDHLTVGAFGGSPVPLSTVTALRERMPQLRLVRDRLRHGRTRRRPGHRLLRRPGVGAVADGRLRGAPPRGRGGSHPPQPDGEDRQVPPAQRAARRPPGPVARCGRCRCPAWVDRRCSRWWTCHRRSRAPARS